MNIFEMIMSNFEPIRYKTGYYVRKRLLHSGYEILTYDSFSNCYVHIAYVENLN